MYFNISVDIGSSPDSSRKSITFVSYMLSSGDIIESSLDSTPHSASLQVLYTKLPSSNCANVIIFPVYSFEDVAYGVYTTDIFIAITSEYGDDIYTNGLEKLS